MNIIYKYKLKVQGFKQVIELPMGSKILTAQCQDGIICLWVEVDPDRKLVKREFFVRGTGDAIADGIANSLRYINTVQVYPFVWHVYEVM